MSAALIEDVRDRFRPRKLFVLWGAATRSPGAERFVARVVSRWERAAEILIAAFPPAPPEEGSRPRHVSLEPPRRRPASSPHSPGRKLRAPFAAGTGPAEAGLRAGPSRGRLGSVSGTGDRARRGSTGPEADRATGRRPAAPGIVGPGEGPCGGEAPGGALAAGAGRRPPHSTPAPRRDRGRLRSAAGGSAFAEGGGNPAGPLEVPVPAVPRRGSAPADSPRRRWRARGPAAGQRAGTSVEGAAGRASDAAPGSRDRLPAVDARRVPPEGRSASPLERGSAHPPADHPWGADPTEVALGRERRRLASLAEWERTGF